MSSMTAAAVAGLGTGASLIIAIGAQNAFVLRQGIRREAVAAVVAVCTLSDVVLIAAGTAGLGAGIERLPWLLTTVRYAGAAFLLTYAVLAARRALRPEALTTDPTAPASSTTLRTAVLTAIALTWLNPHVYLDTVLLLGSIAATHGPSGRWAFAAGAACASLLWFTSLGFGARRLAGVFARPRAWQVLDLVVAGTMVAVAAGLVLGG